MRAFSRASNRSPNTLRELAQKRRQPARRQLHQPRAQQQRHRVRRPLPRPREPVQRHVPPRKAFNDEPTTSYTIMDWLAREEGGLTGGKIAQRGAGDLVLCQRCNNITGSWYGGELVRAAGAGARILNETPLDELDASLDHAWATVKFKQQPKIGPHPLRLIKQIVAMLLAVSPVGFSEANPELSQFILERDRTGFRTASRSTSCSSRAQTLAASVARQTSTSSAVGPTSLSRSPTHRSPT